MQLPIVNNEQALSTSSWQWQLQNSLRNAEDFVNNGLQLTSYELEGIRQRSLHHFPIATTPYYFGLVDKTDPTCPIRRQVIPRVEELRKSIGDLEDPLGEKEHNAAEHLIQRYPDRVLLFITDRCAIYCRFCTRSHLVGAGGGIRTANKLSKAFDYIRENKNIREVILSGGDPLTINTEKLVSILSELRKIEHIDSIRIGTRTPCVLPQRIQPELVEALATFHPIWIMTHFNHPKELTPEVKRACDLLAKHGFPMMNHTVLLSGVNDNKETLEKLFRGLVRLRVKPYYLLQADPVVGTAHLRTPLEVGLKIMKELQGRLSGIATPRFIVDTPGGKGKVSGQLGQPINTNNGPQITRFETWRGISVDYIDPPAAKS